MQRMREKKADMVRLAGRCVAAVWLLAVAAPAHAVSVSFISASDTHFMAPEELNDRERAILATMNNVAARTLGGVAIPPPRGVTVAGDMISGGTATVWGYWVRDFGLTGGDGAVLKLPVYETYGGSGHDGTVTLAGIKARNANRFGLTDYDAATGNCSWDWGGIHFVTAGVKAAEADLTWLQYDLTTHVGASGRPVMLMEHEDWNNLAQSLYDDVLKNYNVIALLNGHESSGVGAWNGITVLDSNSYNSAGYYVVQIDRTTLEAGRTTGSGGNMALVANKTISVPACLAAWTGTGSGIWGTAGNWSGGAAPQTAGDYASFEATVGGTPATVTLDGDRTLSGLDFDHTAAGYTIAPGTPAGRLIFRKNKSDGTLAAGASVSISVNGSHTIAAPVTLNNDAAIMVHPGGQLTISGAVDGAGKGLAKAGAGTLVLAAANTYTGPTAVAAGTIRLTNSNGLPGGLGVAGGASNLTFNGGTVELTDTDFLRPLGAAAHQVQFLGPGGFLCDGSSGDRTVNLGGAAAPVAWGSGGFVPGGAALRLGSTAGVLHFQNPINLGSSTRTIDVGSGAAQLDGGLSGTGGLLKTGSGTLILARAASYTGGTTIAAGTLQLGADGTSGSGSDFTLSGKIDGSGDLFKAGTTTVTLGAANTYTGGTTVAGGTLKMGHAGALSFGAPLTLGAALPATTVAGALDLNGKTTGGRFTLAGGALFNNSSNPATIGSLAGLTLGNGGSGVSGTSAAVALAGGSGSGAEATASLGLTTASITFTAVGRDYVVGDILHVTGGGGDGALIKITGTTGSGYIDTWSLIALGSGYTSAPTAVVGGGSGRNATITGNADNFQVVSLSLTLPGSGYTALPTVSLSGGSGFSATAVRSSLELTAASSIGGAGDITVWAPVTGNFGLTKIGAGTVTLAGGWYTAAQTLNVHEGTLRLAETALDLPQLTVSTAAGATWSVADRAHTVGAISGAGTTAVAAGAGLTANSIVQDTLSIGAGGSVTIRTTSASGAASAADVPEPGVLTLLGAGVLAGLTAWRRGLFGRKKSQLTRDMP